MNKLVLIIALVATSVYTYAQELITDRPDQTESAQVVPLHSLQIESGYVFETKIQPGEKTITANSTLLRYGIIKDFELRLGVDYSIYTPKTGAAKLKGFNPIYVGFKLEFTNEDGVFPGIALLGGLGIPKIASEDFKTDRIAPDLRLAFSHTFSEKLSLGYNVAIEWDGNHNMPVGVYTVALGLGLTEKFGCYIEAFGDIWNKEGVQQLADGGLTFLLYDNLQIDASAGIGLNDMATDYYLSAGLSWRIPR